MALRMLQEDRIHLLGTDCHNLNSRKPNLDKALDLVRKKLGEDALRRVSAYGADILGDI
jgi:protein-tyrosine phosphatase